MAVSGVSVACVEPAWSWPWHWIALAYLACLAFTAWMHRSEFRESPEKGERYCRLPLACRLLCPVIVIPLLLSAVFWHPAMFLPGLVALACVQNVCIRWYRRHGLY